MLPYSLAVIILEERGLIMGNEDEMEPMSRNGIPLRPREFISLIVPKMETQFISLPLLNKSTSILHHLVLLMAINIKSICLFAITIVHLPHPLTSCVFRNRWL